MRGELPDIPDDLDAPSFLKRALEVLSPGNGEGFARLLLHLLEVRLPAQYVGEEFGILRKDWDTARFRLALGFPDLYTLGMSYLGMQVLYHLVNRPEEATPTRAVASGGPYLCERFFYPNADMQELMRRQGVSLFTLESKRPLRDFDAVGFSFNNEGTYSNLPRILRLAAIPVWQHDRNDADPIVIGGGECMLNPEPIADFLDAVAIGDGEELILDIAHCLAELRGASREKRLAELSHVPGIYVPSFYRSVYDDKGRFARLEPRDDLPPGVYAPERITKRLLKDFARWRPPSSRSSPGWIPRAARRISKLCAAVPSAAASATRATFICRRGLASRMTS